MPNINYFKEKLKDGMNQDLTPKEMAEHIIMSALETEFGKSFTLTPGFAKMVKTLADSVVTSPDLRRQALSIASIYIEQNHDNQTNIK